MSKKYALISVFDKTNIALIAKELVAAGYTLTSSGGTYNYLNENKIICMKIEDITKVPELFDGRIKTLNHKIAGGLLYERDKNDHVKQADQHEIPNIEVLICNFYDFNQKPSIEMIDIGGPTMVRAASKNFESTYVLTNHSQYEDFIKIILRSNILHNVNYAKYLAERAFAYVSDYDASIWGYFALSCEKNNLRYGENPHQRAQSFVNKTIKVVKDNFELSYNNYLDIEAALKFVSEFEKPATVVIKHTNPCGAAVSTDAKKSFQLAWTADNVSAFGSIVGTNYTVDEEFIGLLKGKYIEVICAPKFSDSFISYANDKKNKLRLVTYDKNRTDKVKIYKNAFGSFLQETDKNYPLSFDNSPKNAPFNDKEFLRFAEITSSILKSNTVTINLKTTQGDFVLIGVGCGQPNRIDSLELLAIPRHKNAIERLKGEKLIGNISKSDLMVASDGFLPFRDFIDCMAKHELTNLIQPGGSVRDNEVKVAASEHKINMCMTGRRHFLH